MTWRRCTLSLLLACVAAGSDVAAQGAPESQAPAVRVRTSADRSAMWIADRVRYDVEVRCARGVDILDDDLVRERLKLDGLDVVSSETSRQTGADETTTYRFAFVLTTYRVTPPVVQVHPSSLRYFVRRPGQRLEDAAPAGEVQVPGLEIAVRSVLPDRQDTAELRDARRAVVRSRAYALAQPVGVGLVLVATVPTILWATEVARRGRRRVARRSGRQVRQQERASVAAVRALDLSVPDARREAYSSLDRVVRDHLHDVLGVPGRSLTAAEVGPALGERHARAPAETIEALLAECERARYAPPDRLPSADACREAIARAEQVLAGH